MTGPFVLAIIAATALVVFWHMLAARVPLPSSPPPPAMPMHVEPRTDTDLLQLLRSVPGDCAPLLRDSGIALQQQLVCGALPVFVQQNGIRQLLANIVTIAAHAMARGGTLKVLARAEGAQAVVHFVDMAADGEHVALARLFERAVSGPRETAPGSVGACAASCQRLATEHGGRVYAAPAPSGEFGLTLRLPLCALLTGNEVAGATVRGDAA